MPVKLWWRFSNIFWPSQNIWTLFLKKMGFRNIQEKIEKKSDLVYWQYLVNPQQSQCVEILYEVAFILLIKKSQCVEILYEVAFVLLIKKSQCVEILYEVTSVLFKDSSESSRRRRKPKHHSKSHNVLKFFMKLHLADQKLVGRRENLLRVHSSTKTLL